MSLATAVPLGGLSVALGVTQLAAPRTLAKWIGVPDRPLLLRALGAREILSGLGLLAGRRRRTFAWLRLFGDVMDLALLGVALSRRRSMKLELARLKALATTQPSMRTVGVTAAVLGVAALDYLAARRLGRRSEPVHEAVTVNLPLDQVQLRLTSLPRPRGELTLCVSPSGGTELHLVSTARRHSTKVALHNLKELIEVGEVTKVPE